MTLIPMNSYTLIRGCALFADRRSNNSHYVLGTIERVATVTSAFQRTALMQLADGCDPLARVSMPVCAELELFLASLARIGLLSQNRHELTVPKRNINDGDVHDRAIAQLRARSGPELAQSEWIDGCGDGGTSTLAARSQFPIELSGRGRVLTILYSLLLASGVTRVRFADRHLQSTVSDLDIGCGAITAADLGSNYYEVLESRRRALSLFPIEVGARYDTADVPALATIHYGDSDPEQILDWSHLKRPHLLIHAPIGDEVAIGPFVLPGESPCLRCLSLHEIDMWGFTRLERIELTPVAELPIAIAHYVAAVAATHILHFIDSCSAKSSSEIARNTSVGEVTYVNFQHITEPQVVAIARHPLCGCDF